MQEITKNILKKLATLRDKINENVEYMILKYDLSKLDADLKDDITNANYKSIVVDNDTLLFLERYNLEVISLEENENLTEPTINEVKKLIKDGKIKYIYSLNSTSNETVNSLIDSLDIELLTLNSMNSIDGQISNTNENYLTIMNDNIELLNKELFK